MKISITGANGKLGSRLVRLGVHPINADILRQNEIRRELNSIKPDIVIHAAAMSRVADCEANYDRAIAVNVHGTADVFESAADVIGEGRCVLLSSEQVFDGKKGNYTEADEPNPIHSYGFTKFAAEGLAEMYDNKVVRLSRGVDIDEKDIAGYLDMLQKGQEIHVPTFMYRSYSHMDFLATAILYYCSLFEDAPEYVHLGGIASMSFYSFMKLVASKFGFSTSLVLPRDEEETLATRPYKCGLDVSRAAGMGIPLFNPEETVNRMKTEWNSKQRL